MTVYVPEIWRCKTDAEMIDQNAGYRTEDHCAQDAEKPLQSQIAFDVHDDGQTGAFEQDHGAAEHDGEQDAQHQVAPERQLRIVDDQIGRIAAQCVARYLRQTLGQTSVRIDEVRIVDRLAVGVALEFPSSLEQFERVGNQRIGNQLDRSRRVVDETLQLLVSLIPLAAGEELGAAVLDLAEIWHHLAPSRLRIVRMVADGAAALHGQAVRGVQVSVDQLARRGIQIDERQSRRAPFAAERQGDIRRIFKCLSALRYGQEQ